MTLLAPTYRNDYIGENINGYNTEGEPYSIFVPPRPNVFIQPSTNTAIVLGNGRSKNIDQVKYLLEINSKKSAEGYKLVYACNKAINDDMAYDYYVLRHRVFMSNISQDKLTQVYLPADIFLDYKDQTNLIPYVNHGFDAGAMASFIACFDGHKKIMLVGFDGDLGNGYKTAYDSEFPYSEPDLAEWSKWQDYLYHIMKIYKDVEFFRLAYECQAAPAKWLTLPNFKDCTMRDFVLAGDF